MVEAFALYNRAADSPTWCAVCQASLAHAHLDSTLEDGTMIQRQVCLLCFWRFRDHFTAVQEFQMGICQETNCRYCVGMLASGGYNKAFTN